MHGSAFDRLTRSLSTSPTRRGFLRLVTSLPLGMVLASIMAGEATKARGREAHPPHARRQHRHTKMQRGKERRHDTHTEACIPTGQRCPSKKPRGMKGQRLRCRDCCQGAVTKNATGKNVCACQPNGATCSGQTATSCCSGFCNG